MFGGGLRIGLLNADQETALEVEEGVQVQEDVVDLVSANDSLFLHKLLEHLQQLQMLDVSAFSLDQFINDVFSLCSLHDNAERGIHGFGL